MGLSAIFACRKTAGVHVRPFFEQRFDRLLGVQHDGGRVQDVQIDDVRPYDKHYHGQGVSSGKSVHTKLTAHTKRLDTRVTAGHVERGFQRGGIRVEVVPAPLPVRHEGQREKDGGNEKVECL